MQITLSKIDPQRGTVRLEALTLREGASVKEALTKVNLPEETPVALFTQKVTLDTVLKEGDRLDIGSPLRVDPKKARLYRVEHKNETKTPFARHGGHHQLVK